MKSKSLENTSELCFFCEKKGNLYNASTFSLNGYKFKVNVRRSAHDLQDEKVSDKLSYGYMVAIEAKYQYSITVSLISTKNRLSWNKNLLLHQNTICNILFTWPS